MSRKPRAFSILTIQNQSPGNCLCKNNARCISLSPRCMSLGKLKKTAAPEQHQRRLREILLSPRRRVRLLHTCCGSHVLFEYVFFSNQSPGNCLCKNNTRCISLSPRCMSLGKLKKTAASEQRQRRPRKILLSPRRRVRFCHKCCGTPALFQNMIDNMHKGFFHLS